MASWGRDYVPIHPEADLSYSSSEDIYGTGHDKPKPRRIRPAFMALVVGFLATVVVFQNLYLLSKHHQKPVNDSATGLGLVRDQERVADQSTRFLSPNMTDSAIAWASIEAGHGLVAVDVEWASARHLPDTISHPNDPTKAVYIIAAYHAIHCVKYLHRHYLALAAGKPVTWPREHDLHCFDSLRQHIMCAADDTLLYTTGHKDAGHGQSRMCRDWDALRAWATEHSACYADHEWPSSRTRWGQCDGGVDGLPLGSLLD